MGEGFTGWRQCGLTRLDGCRNLAIRPGFIDRPPDYSSSTWFFRVVDLAQNQFDMARHRWRGDRGPECSAAMKPLARGGQMQGFMSF